MSPRALVRALAASRIALGVAMVAAPRRAATPWIGSDADSGGVSVLGRALGIRDTVLGGMLLHTVDHPQVARRWIATCAVCDGVDGAAAVAARRDLPPLGALAFTTVALGSAVAHALLAQRITSPSGLASVAAQSPPAPASSPEVVMPDGAEEAKRAMGARTVGVDTASGGGGVGSGTGPGSDPGATGGLQQ